MQRARLLAVLIVCKVGHSAQWLEGAGLGCRALGFVETARDAVAREAVLDQPARRKELRCMCENDRLQSGDIQSSMRETGACWRRARDVRPHIGGRTGTVSEPRNDS